LERERRMGGSIVPPINVSDNPASFAEILLEERKRENLATLKPCNPRERNQSILGSQAIHHVCSHQIIIIIFILF
jgi:hypothetical protein